MMSRNITTRKTKAPFDKKQSAAHESISFPAIKSSSCNDFNKFNFGLSNVPSSLNFVGKGKSLMGEVNNSDNCQKSVSSLVKNSLLNNNWSAGFVTPVGSNV